MDESRYYGLSIFDMPPLMSVAEWAQKYRYMPSTSSMFSYKPTPFFELPATYMSDIAETSMVVLKTSAQLGKDLAWSTPIPTPKGLVLMEDLREGDYVYSMDGTQTRVSFKTGEQYNKMYRVHFDDGTYLDAGEDHRWLASMSDGSQRRKPETVYTTQQMVDEIERRKNIKTFWSRGKLRSIFSIRMPDPVQNEEKELPIDPYTLGFWLGDGCSRQGEVYKPECDLKEVFPQYAHLIRKEKNRCEKLTIPGLTHALKQNNLLCNKHIPEEYFNSSIEQRLSLLQGLMDTDGTSPKKDNSTGEWCQKSERLTRDMVRLLCSLGIKSHVHKRTKRIKSFNFEGEYFFITFSTDLPVFRLKRKLDRMGSTVRNDAHWRYIRSIEPIPTVKSYCIAVEHPSHTYLAGHQCCVTHNTTAIENFLGWMVTYHPSNTMLILDSMKSGIKMSQNRIRPFLRNTCGVNNPGSTAKKNPDKSNSVINIGLGSGANLFVCSAKSVSDLRSTPSRFVLCDEVDAYNDTTEGDPIELALKRQMRFRGMTILTSTPTTPEGRITQHYLLGTQQTWGCRCTCGAFMDVLYKDIDFNGDIPTYYCRSCGQVYSESDIKQLPHCYCEPKNPNPFKDNLGRIRRSFEIMATLCHEFYSWDGLKRSELAALSLGEASYRSFVNTTLGEAYTPKDEVEMSMTDLMRLTRTEYDLNTLPCDVAFIVCGIDTHDQCLYCETAGFSADLKRIYGIDYRILPGDPNEHEVWDQLTELMNEVYYTDDGRELRPAFAFADSGGHRTNAVYLYSYRNKRFLPVKGFVSSKEGVVDPLLGKLSKLPFNYGLKGKVKVQMVGVNAGKDALQHMEVLTITGEKRLFYPPLACYNTEYFSGLISEKKIGGRWVAPSSSKINNEPLDCRVYAMACAEYYLQKYYLTGKDKEISKMPRKKKEVVEEVVETIEEPKQEVKEEKPSPQPEKPKPSHPAVKPEQPKKVIFPHW